MRWKIRKISYNSDRRNNDACLCVDVMSCQSIGRAFPLLSVVVTVAVKSQPCSVAYKESLEFIDPVNVYV